MVEWNIRFKKKAQKDSKLLKAAHLEGRVERIIDVLRADPYGNPPPFEKMEAEQRGAYSRRINIHHRLVYKIHPESRTVVVCSMFSHYGD